MADNGIIAAIHCNTKEKEKKLLAEFDKMGKYWVTGTSYRNKWWNTCKDETCYDNEGRFNNQCYYRNMGNIIYEFEDIIFDDDKTVCIPMQKKTSCSHRLPENRPNQNVKRQKLLLCSIRCKYKTK